jgi:hypothetical protein
MNTTSIPKSARLLRFLESEPLALAIVEMLKDIEGDELEYLHKQVWKSWEVYRVGLSWEKGRREYVFPERKIVTHCKIIPLRSAC